MPLFSRIFTMLLTALAVTACSSLYYSSLEKIGIPKREIMVYRVKKARDTQQETKQQFKSALARFTELTHYQGGDLEEIYNRLNSEYEASVDKAQQVRTRIDDIEDVSEALFEEWQEEITQYSSVSLKASSARKLARTRRQYARLIEAMNRAYAKIAPVLAVFKDQVLYLKHNLNAQAISSLQGELKTVESDVSVLVAAMEKSINEADAFIESIEQ